MLQILQDLQRTGGMTLLQMSEQYGSCERTIRRDLSAIERAGFKLQEEQLDKRKLWKLDLRAQSNRLFSLLDKGHYFALRVAMGQGGPARTHATLFTALEDLSDKIETSLGKRGRKQLEDIQSCFHSYEKHAYAQAAPDVLWQLVAAISERRVCRVFYRRPHATVDKDFEILPLKLFAHQGAAYLMTHVLKHDTLATLNLQRVRKLIVLDRQAEVPQDFDPSRLENVAFGVHTGGQLTRYVLRFDREVSDYIRERIWHPSQSLVALEEGGVELSFQCGASWEVSAWVASWRHWVEVVEPLVLRDELRELGERLIERYR